MNLAMNQDQENHENQNIVPLSSNEIKSILKSQSKSTFEDKNIKDSLIFANTVAGISTTRVGTAKSMPTREEIDKLL